MKSFGLSGIVLHVCLETVEGPGAECVSRSRSEAKSNPELWDALKDKSGFWELQTITQINTNKTDVIVKIVEMVAEFIRSA
ncbi:hypothetical protein PoB_002106200 [Plakobranchus ocellatus]|uniref:Uncharacterized protein n=1 Tax=Plakobranchus ocellatus TaxID=259542 RepID=A0AAV3ZJ44_9GAST|nr:hypothetical protein PoB_002106200 [Plakobranchus ocellatus]